METLKTIVIDVKESVFDNETEAILYVTKDIYSDSFIIALPAYTFSWDVREHRIDQDLNELLSFNIFGDRDRREKLVGVIREGIERL